MRRIAVLVASALINISTIPALSAQFTLHKDVNSAREVAANVHSKPTSATDNEKICSAYAASFYRSEMRRQAAAGRVDDAWVLTVLNCVVTAVDDLLATKCGS